MRKKSWTMVLTLALAMTIPCQSAQAQASDRENSDFTAYNLNPGPEVLRREGTQFLRKQGCPYIAWLIKNKQGTYIAFGHWTNGRQYRIIKTLVASKSIKIVRLTGIDSRHVASIKGDEITIGYQKSGKKYGSELIMRIPGLQLRVRQGATGPNRKT